MSVDTRDKRFSMIGLDLPEETIMLTPIGAIGRPGRELLLDLYAGLVLSPPASFLPAWTVNANVEVGPVTPQPVIR